MHGGVQSAGYMVNTSAAAHLTIGSFSDLLDFGVCALDSATATKAVIGAAKAGNLDVPLDGHAVHGRWY